jgi:hypothetical protein
MPYSNETFGALSWSRDHFCGLPTILLVVYHFRKQVQKVPANEVEAEASHAAPAVVPTSQSGPVQDSLEDNLKSVFYLFYYF